jgi:hypothetical protein
MVYYLRVGCDHSLHSEVGDTVELGGDEHEGNYEDSTLTTDLQLMPSVE